MVEHVYFLFLWIQKVHFCVPEGQRREISIRSQAYYTTCRSDQFCCCYQNCLMLKRVSAYIARCEIQFHPNTKYTVHLRH